MFGFLLSCPTLFLLHLCFMESLPEQTTYTQIFGCEITVTMLK